MKKAQAAATKASDASANVANTIKNRDAGTKIKQQNANTSKERADNAAANSAGSEPAGTIIIDTSNKFLFLSLGGGWEAAS